MIKQTISEYYEQFRLKNSDIYIYIVVSNVILNPLKYVYNLKSINISFSFIFSGVTES